MKHLHLQSTHYHYLQTGFMQWLDTLGYAETTVKSLPVHVREFLHYLEQRNVQHITKVKGRHVSEFIHHLKVRGNQKFGGGLSASHINKTIQAITSFGQYLNQTGKHVLDISPRRMENDVDERTILTREEIKSLYEATFTPHRQNSMAIGQRDRAIIAIFYGCGLRKDEGSRLDITDIDLVKRLVFVKKAKGNRQRYVPIAIKHADDIQAYLEEGRNWFLHDNRSAWHVRRGFKKQEADAEAFFVGMEGTRMKSFYARINYLREKAGIEKQFSTHNLRHSIATHLLQSGMAIEEIARFLGHRSLESTQIYTHIVNRLEKQEQHDAGLLLLS